MHRKPSPVRYPPGGAPFGARLTFTLTPYYVILRTNPSPAHAAASAAIPQVVHGVLVDECEAKVYVAAREPGRVLVLDMAKGLQLHTTIDLAAAGG